jgi:hypothetical protein
MMTSNQGDAEMTTKTTTTATGNTITVEIVRKVQDKVSYADGANIVTGREIVDYTTITLRDSTGKTIATGKEIYCLNQKSDAKGIAGGAVAKIGKAYLRQDNYNLAVALLAEVEAETPKSDEQIAIESARAQAAKDYDAWYASAEQVTARKFAHEMNRTGSDY